MPGRIKENRITMSIKIKKDKDNPETSEVLADAILRIADGFEKLLKTNLNDNAIVQLLMGMPGMSGQLNKSQIKLVLKNLKILKGYYLKKK